MVAPFAIYYELPSTLLGASRRSRIDRNDAQNALDAFLSLDIPIVGADLQSIASLDRDAYVVAERFGCSFYDAIFIALAEGLDTQVLTAEKNLYDRLKDTTSRLLWLANLQLP